MSASNSQAQMVARRAELMAELFFQSLDAAYVARFEHDLAFDLLVGLPNQQGGIDNFAVEVKATQQPVRSGFRIPRKIHERLSHSNTPAMLLVADVKQDRLYYAWLRPEQAAAARSDRDTIVVPLTEIDEGAKARLREELAAQRSEAMAA
jgi:hypothetical protein